MGLWVKEGLPWPRRRSCGHDAAASVRGSSLRRGCTVTQRGAAELRGGNPRGARWAGKGSTENGLVYQI